MNHEEFALFQSPRTSDPRMFIKLEKCKLISKKEKNTNM